MPLLINKDGKQMGPYSVEEARALVLSGELTATDWAWPDGATQWIRLKDVAGFSSAVPAGTADAPPPPPNTEQDLWRGHPSQVLNLGTYISWLAILLLVASFSTIQAVGSIALIVAGVLAVIALIQIVFRFMRLRASEYVVTTQRVRVISGLLGKDVQEIELFRVKDTSVNQSFLLRLFGLGTITIVSGDANHPRLVLHGVPQAVELRERLRQEVMILRQRFGVRELDTM